MCHAQCLAVEPPEPWATEVGRHSTPAGSEDQGSKCHCWGRSRGFKIHQVKQKVTVIVQELQILSKIPMFLKIHELHKRMAPLKDVSD